MQFIPNGPIIPIEVIEALENDKLVFFCGAGVSRFESYPAYGSFPDLLSEVKVKHPYEEPLEADTPNVNKEKINEEKIFEDLNQIHGPDTIKKAICEILTFYPETANVQTLDELKKHQTLLKLSRNLLKKNYQPRLVTTNFDNCFEIGNSLLKSKPENPIIQHYADALPVPDKDWRSLVYLHGKANVHHSKMIYHHSAFAKAYLWDQWAVNFLKKLFNGHFTVIFIGYSMSDPLMRYVTQAIDDENKPYMFIHENEKNDPEIDRLGILKIPVSDYLVLWKSLERWAELFESGRTGWIGIALEIASEFPRSDDWPDSDKTNVETMTQILSDVTKAKEIIKDLPIEWLDVFENIHEIQEGQDEQIYFNVLHPPSQDRHGAEFGCIANRFKDTRPLHPVTIEIGYWLAEHLKEKKVLDFVIKNGAILHPELLNTFRIEFQRWKKLEGINNPPLAREWELIIFHAKPYLSRHESSIPLRHPDLSTPFLQSSYLEKIITLLKPRLDFTIPFPNNSENPNNFNPPIIQITVSCDLNFLFELFNNQLTPPLISSHPIVFQRLVAPIHNHLEEVLRLAEMIELPNEALNTQEVVRTANPLQNLAFRGWVLLVDWLWLCFDCLDSREKEHWINRWSSHDALLFRRFALQAYNRPNTQENLEQ
jgi:NAD-dependent SIR2 family protein deacetylase